MNERTDNARFDVIHHGNLGDNPDGTKLYASLPMALARDSRLTHAARSVALYVWSHAPSHHQSASDVAKAIGTTRKTVSNALKNLQDNGWLVRQPYWRTGATTQSFEVWHLQVSNTPFTPEEVESLSRPVDVPCVETTHPPESFLPTPLGSFDSPPWVETTHHRSTSSSRKKEVDKEVDIVETSAEAMGSDDPFIVFESLNDEGHFVPSCDVLPEHGNTSGSPLATPNMGNTSGSSAELDDKPSVVAMARGTSPSGKCAMAPFCDHEACCTKR